MLRALSENLTRVHQNIQERQVKLNQNMERKRDQETKNYSEFMRRNKKHDPGSDYAVIKPLRKPFEFTLPRNRFLSTHDSSMRKMQSQARMPNRNKEVPKNIAEDKKTAKVIK